MSHARLDLRHRAAGFAAALLLTLGAVLDAPRAAAAPTAVRTEVVFLELSGLT